MNLAKYALFLLSLGLSGCATVSFAPPIARGDKAVTDDGKCADDGNGQAIGHDTAGALGLIENYRIAYWCAHRKLANGRQFFEVPSALVLAGGAAAAAAGVPPEVAIGTGAAAATLAQGNRYYDPKAKALIVAAALDAIVCIKQEASGVSALDLSTGTKAFGAFHAANPAISFSPELQYYQLVSAALQNVDSVAAQRLRAVGSYAPDAIATEITALAKAIEEKQSATNKAKADTTAKALGIANPLTQAAVVQAIVDLEVLQPKLRLCVMRAKSS